MKRNPLILLTALAFAANLFAQDTVRVMSYNFLGLANNQSTSSRLPAFKTIINAINPDVIIAVEVDNAAGCDTLLFHALDSSQYARAEFIDGRDSDAMLFFRKAMFAVDMIDVIPTVLRNMYIYQVRYLAKPEAPVIHFGAVHLKAGETSDDSATRVQEVAEFINQMTSDHPHEHIVLGGDFNFYTSDEAAYKALLKDSLLYDPIDQPGVWHDKVQFAQYHTQSTRKDMFGGGSGGGLDDRFDFLLPSKEFVDDDGWAIIPGSYTAFGNDGRHLNTSVNDGNNSAVSRPVANALFDASDHLPVYMDILYTPKSSITLLTGWNLAATPRLLTDTSIVNIFQPLVDNDNLILVKDQAGNFYDPATPFNSIAGWDSRYGYWVKVKRSASLTPAYEPGYAEAIIPLRNGWSAPSYLPEEQVSAATAFDKIKNYLILAKDDDGRFYAPAYQFSNMGLLHRWTAYRVQTNAVCGLDWNTVAPAGPEAVRLIEAPDLETAHYTAPPASPLNMSVVIRWDRGELWDGDELAAFAPDGQCVGTVVLTSDGTTGMAIMGDVPGTELCEGLKPGDPVAFKLWDGYRSLPVATVWSQGDGRYRTDALARATILQTPLQPDDYSLVSAFPNPFNGAVRLNYLIENAGSGDLTIFSLDGRAVAQLHSGRFEAGWHNDFWRAENLPSGVYFARLTVNGIARTGKLVLMR